MFGTLFLKECKATLKSVTYVVFLVCLLTFYVMQMGDADSAITEPEKNQDYYGMRTSTNHVEIMETLLGKLRISYEDNSYPTYPVGFYKNVILNEKKQSKVEGYIEDMSNGVTYDRFLEIMGNVDELLGGGSSFAPSRIKHGVSVPMTYEEALLEYKGVIEADEITRSYARLFCDYMGLIIGILPVFLVVSRQLRDKRSKALEVIWSKPSSSLLILFSRFLAQAVMILLPLLLISLLPMSQALYQADYLNTSPDYLAFVEYILGWLMPTALFCLAVGYFFTELSGSVLAVFVQGIYWIVSAFSATDLVGHVGLNMMPRFNSLYGLDIFSRILPELIINRIGYVVAALLLFAMTVFLYSYKRKGGRARNGKNSSDLEGAL